MRTVLPTGRPHGAPQIPLFISRSTLDSEKRRDRSFVYLTADPRRPFGVFENRITMNPLTEYNVRNGSKMMETYLQGQVVEDKVTVVRGRVYSKFENRVID
jgi:hypothetical protein